MNKFVIGAVGFVLGAAAGSVTAYYICKKKMQTQIDEEVQEVRDYYRDKSKDAVNTLTELKKNMDVTEYTKLTKAYAPSFVEEVDEEADEEIVDDPGEPISYPAIDPTKDEPYIIRPTAVGEEEDYSILTFHYYRNNEIFTDEMDEPLGDLDLESICGPKDNILSSFGLYEEEPYVVAIQNDQRRQYVEILLTEMNYADVLRKKSYILFDHPELEHLVGD